MPAKLILPEDRRKCIRNILCVEKRFARILEAHTGLSAILVSSAATKQGEKTVEFDGIWISGLTENYSRGLPDIELQGLSSRIGLIREIINVTHKPIVVDADTGGTLEQIQRNMRNLEILGVSGIVMEDKVFPKNNSLDPSKPQTLEIPEVFANKIKKGKEALLSGDMMIFARLEALIAGESVAEAIRRAEIYAKAGADGIVIHSNQKSPQQILDFAKEYKRAGLTLPLVAIPTTYNTITEDELKAHGFSLVIYANQMLRASYCAMKTVAETILKNGRSLEVDPLCIPVKQMLEISDDF